MDSSSSAPWYLQRSLMMSGRGSQTLTLWTRRPTWPLQDDAGDTSQAVVVPYTPTTWGERFRLLGRLLFPAREREPDTLRVLGWGLTNPRIAAAGALVSRPRRRAEWINHPMVPAALWRWRVRTLGWAVGDLRDMEYGLSVMQRPDAPPAWRDRVLGVQREGPQGVVLRPHGLKTWAELTGMFVLDCRSVSPARWADLVALSQAGPPRVRRAVWERLSVAPEGLPPAVWERLAIALAGRPPLSCAESETRGELATLARLALRADIPEALRTQLLAALDPVGQGPAGTLTPAEAGDYAMLLVHQVAADGPLAWDEPAVVARVAPVVERALAALSGSRPAGVAPETVTLSLVVRWVELELSRGTAGGLARLQAFSELFDAHPEILLLARRQLDPAALGRQVLEARLAALGPGVWRRALLSPDPAWRLLAMEGLAVVAAGRTPDSALTHPPLDGGHEPVDPAPLLETSARAASGRLNQPPRRL